MEYVRISKAEYTQLLLYKQILNYVEEELHEKEQFKDSFVSEVEKISSDTQKGKKISFRTVNEMNAYLDGL